MNKDGVKPTLETGYCSNWDGIGVNVKPTLFVTKEVTNLPEASASSIGTTNSVELTDEVGWKRIEDREYANGQYSKPDIPAGSDVLVYNFTVKAKKTGSYAFRPRVPCRNRFDIDNKWKIVSVQAAESGEPGNESSKNGDQPPEKELGPVQTLFFKIVDIIGGVL